MGAKKKSLQQIYSILVNKIYLSRFTRKSS